MYNCAAKGGEGSLCSSPKGQVERIISPAEVLGEGEENFWFCFLSAEVGRRRWRKQLHV